MRLKKKQFILKMSTLKILEKIGHGNYGDVYKVENNEGKTFAVKIIDANKIKYTEIDILNRIECPYLMRNFGNPIVNTKLGKGISMKLACKNFNYLNFNSLSYKDFKKIIISLLLGLKCLHSKGFLHFDLDLRNLLYNKVNGEYNVYISDFGLTIKCENSYKGVRIKIKTVGKNIPYEHIDKIDDKIIYNDKSDVWSLGMSFLSMIGVRHKYKNKENLLEYKKTYLNYINQSFIEERVKLFCKGKTTSKREMLSLIELLNGMLKRNPEERISTKNIEEMSFFRNAKYDDICFTKIPKELYVIPYISSSFSKSIERMKNLALINNFNLEEYFVSIQQLLTVMGQVQNDVSEIDLDFLIDKIFSAVNNYFKNKKTDYFMAEKLNGYIAYNPLYEKAYYLDDLILINHFLNTSSNLVSIFNVMDINKFYHQLREDYVYDRSVTKKNITLREFFKKSVPIKRIDGSIKLNEYVDVKEEYLPSKNKTYTNVEKIFRGILLEKIKDKIENNIDIFDRYSQRPKVNILQKFKDLIEFDVFNEDYYINKKFVIVEDEISLLIVDKNKKVVNQYYGDENLEVEQFYKDKGYKYYINYDYGTGFCDCKILEFCLIYIIFYNTFTKKDDLNIKCINDKTIKVMLLYSLLRK